MKAYLYAFLAAMFLSWIIDQQEEEPEILLNAAAAIVCVVGFIIICLGVFELCQ